MKQIFSAITNSVVKASVVTSTSLDVIDELSLGAKSYATDFKLDAEADVMSNNHKRTVRIARALAASIKEFQELGLPLTNEMLEVEKRAKAQDKKSK